MLEFYHSPLSTCSQKVRLALAEKALPWASHHIQFNQGDHLSPEYLKLNPNGVVPTLVHDGAVITDSSVINEYLEDVYPEPPLRPCAPARLAHLRTCAPGASTSTKCRRWRSGRRRSTRSSFRSGRN